MKVEMNENQGLDISDVNLAQIGLLVQALKESPNQDFMNDPELGKLFKLMAIVQSDVFDDMKAGKVDFSQFKSN